MLTIKKLKPDLVIIKPTEIIIIDVSIVTANMRFQHMQEPGTLNNIWEYKARYYNNEQLKASLTERFGPAEIWNGSVIISSRGLWCSRNNSTLRRCGINLQNHDIMVIRSMERSIKIWQFFMNST